MEDTPQTKARKKPENQLNDLSATEWIAETTTVWTQRGLGQGHKDAQIEKLHPAPFSYQDVSRLIRLFSKRGELVLDPFLGVGSTLKAAALEGRRGIGIELEPSFVRLAKQRIRDEIPDSPDVCLDQKILCGDSLQVLDKLSGESVKLVVTSPPYWKILHKQDHKVRQERVSKGLAFKYSESSKDLGNIEEYPLFISKLGDVFSKCHNLMVSGGYLCVVVGDFREKSRYFMFHADLAIELETRGFTLKGIKILYQRHKRIFPYGYPYAYVPNMHHQYILILRKDG